MTEISIVVPVKNEAENILPLLGEIVSAMHGTDFEIVYVDDGSTDETAREILRARRELYPGLRFLRHSSGCGQSTAIWTGVRAARGRWVGTLDGDGQNDPADIARFYARVRAPDFDPQVKLLIGHRRVRRDSMIRRVSSRLANGVRSKLLHDNAPDTGCGLKLFERAMFLELPYFDHMHRFLPALVQRSGARVESLPVTHRPRMRGQSKYGVGNRLWVGIVDMAGVRWLQRRDRRIATILEE